MTERELERRARHRLAVLRHAEEVSGNVAGLREGPSRRRGPDNRLPGAAACRA
jgi:hypothetical protein